MLKFQHLMIKPGYYKTIYRALRMREMIRWYGWYRGPLAWLKTRFRPPSSSGLWMPGLWAENECKPEALSREFCEITKSQRADFDKLGFVQCRVAKHSRIRTLDPDFHDSGSIFYLDPTHCYLGALAYSRRYDSTQNREFNRLVITFTAVFEKDSLSCTNHRLAFDSPRVQRVIRLKSYEVPVIYQRFQEELRQRPDKPRPFPNTESLREWFDARQIEDFDDRVRRRLFIPMTEPEIKAAWAVLQRGTRTPLPPLPRRGFRVAYLQGAVSLVLLVLIIHRCTQAPGNTIEYRGQQFETRLPYASYDDYKDDPNNLDTNELGRIAQTMESVKIPSAFKDSKEFIDFVVDLQFPGYGLGSFTCGTNTDDGSLLDLECVEIPQANKDRVIVVREFGGNLKLMDDFIYDTSTDEISRVRLHNHQLQYFDEQGRLLRQKRL